MSPRRPLPLLLAGAVCLVALAAVRADAPAPRPQTGNLPTYVRGWSAPYENVLAFALDAQDRAWLLGSDDAFVRLDDQGKIAERIPFVWPADLNKYNSLDRTFTIVGSDFVVGRYRFDRRGQIVALYPYRQAWHLAPGPDGTLVRLSDEGLEIFDRKGRSVRRFSEGGFGPGRISRPMAVEVDRRGRIVVAELDRLQIFDRRGRFLQALNVPVEPQPGGIFDIAIDGDGYLYVWLSAGRGLVVVFDPELRYLGALPLAWEWSPWDLTADRKGRLYGLVPGPVRLLQQAVPAAGSVRLAQPLGGAGGSLRPRPPSVAPAVTAQVHATIRHSPAWPFRLHTSTRRVLAVAADPEAPGRLWLGTEGGLLQYFPERHVWKSWTMADGLPGREVRSLASDGKQVYLVLSKGAAVFDIAEGRFQSIALESRSSTPDLEALRVLPNPGSPGILWWVMKQGLVRHDTARGSWSHYRSPSNLPLVDGVAAAGRIFAASESEVWELRPNPSEWHRVTDVDILDRASTGRRNATHRLRLFALSADPRGRTLWVGTDGPELFRVDVESGKADWPAETRREACGAQRVVRQGDRLLAVGPFCVRETGSGTGWEIDRDRVTQILGALPDPAQPDLLWLATRSGLASLRLSDGRLDVFHPFWTEPDGVRVADLLVAEGRLWVAPFEGDVSVFDPVDKWWKVFSGLSQARSLRRSGANGRILVHHHGRGSGLAWLDPRTSEQVLVPGDWPQIQNPHDLHHDERGLWVLGYSQERARDELTLLRPDGTAKLVIAGDFRHDVRMLPDPAHPGTFLAVTEKQDLVRIHPETGTMETLRSGVWRIHLARDRYLWLSGAPSGRLDLQTGAFAPLLDGNLLPDPRHPDHGILLRDGKLTFYDVPHRERFAEIDLPDNQIYSEVLFLDDRFWVASGMGLLEIPQSALRPSHGVL